VIATDLVTENFSSEIKRKSESAIKNFESIREDIEKSLEWIEGSSLAANAAAAEEFTSMISDLIGQTNELKEKIPTSGFESGTSNWSSRHFMI